MNINVKMVYINGIYKSFFEELRYVEKLYLAFDNTG